MKDLTDAIGKIGSVRITPPRQSGFEVSVEVLAVKRSYGRDRYLVTPLRGKGKFWTEQVKFTRNKTA